ncbi:hypothetical protein LOD99_7363 [Oopsacas minuta]|uniref:Uncharacterized protein n=1 Tax=Oopsacas minuta TaxID=111878 RepID=A0AAV7JTV1_9METZ|nr:hypothetical protein LOD99_7363 [Oopsacas minuta]
MAVAFHTGSKRRISLSDTELDRDYKSPRRMNKYLSIQEARVSIQTKFGIYRQLLDNKELELLSELNQLEDINKPELTHVNADLNRLSETIGTLDDSLCTNTLKQFLEQQKSVWSKQMKILENSKELLSHVSLNYSEFDVFVENIINIVPFLSKSKFAQKLSFYMKLKPRLEEDWCVVSQKWFDSFSNSLNINNRQPNDKWEFPHSIPIDQSGIYTNGHLNINSCQMLHSKAWSMLLRFNGLTHGSSPLKRKPYFNKKTNNIQIPIAPTKHICFIGHNSGDTKFNFKHEIETFPYDTYTDILEKISIFSKRISSQSPLMYCVKFPVNIFFHIDSYIITNNHSLPYDKIRNSSCPRQIPFEVPATSVGVDSLSILFVIPDSKGRTNIKVKTNIPEFRDKMKTGGLLF